MSSNHKSEIANPESLMPDHPTITVGDFVACGPARLQLHVLAGADAAVARRITAARVHKLGLALAGFAHDIHTGRVQIVGQSEIAYLNQLSSERRREVLNSGALGQIACMLVTKSPALPPELAEWAERTGVPLLQTPLVSSLAITVTTEFLQETLAPRETRHGVLLELYGVGVLIEGRSGIGKSECALDLIVRGHRLVADDLVEVRRIAPDQLLGSAPELLSEHLELRGVGIINIRDLFGVSTISGPKNIDLSIKLERWDEVKEVDRLGIDELTAEILGVRVPHFLIPVGSGRNLATLVETAVRVHLSRARGNNAAQTFVARHTASLRAPDVEAESRRVNNSELEDDREETRR